VRKARGQLEVDSILATFGLSFVAVGLMLAVFGGDYFNYSFLARPSRDPGRYLRAEPGGSAFARRRDLCACVYLWLNLSRARLSDARRGRRAEQRAARRYRRGAAFRAVAFALGGAITAMGGALISTFLTLDASTGVIFTLKALIIVIMGGVGDVRGTIVAALLLGLGRDAWPAADRPGPDAGRRLWRCSS
jgi:branched-chain amino acid transport system permease protein